MGIKRGDWQKESVNKMALIKAGRYGARPATIVKDGMSNSENHMNSRNNSVNVSGLPLGVSEHRQEELIRGTGVSASNQSDPGPLVVYSNSYKKSQELRESYILNKTAAISTPDGSRMGVAGSTVRQAPEVYSPLFQIANLQLPRDRITMNAWNRNFYDTHPLVHNCVNLHATYPISKINIKCKDRKVEQFFKDMAEQMDLVNILQAVALEFWKIGEAFPYAELNESEGIWKNIIIQNPDYIHIKTAVIGGESVISMRPDAALQRLVQSNNPADMQLRSQIDEEILYHVKKGNNIPLDNFHVSHLKMLSSAYDIHGTSPIVSIYKDLMLYDKLRECHDVDTEILTDQGVCLGRDVIEYDRDGDKISNVRIKDDLKIACYNSENNQIEYHKPTGVHLSHYKGKMKHFNGEKVDVMVTPNHRMLVSRKTSNGWSDWEIQKAKNMSMGTMYRFRNVADWSGTGENIDNINVNGKNIPINLYMRALGYIVSEGCVQFDKNHGSVSLSQLTSSPDYKTMYDTFDKFAAKLGSKLKSTIKITGSGFSKHAKKEMWVGHIYNKKLANYFVYEIGTNNKCKSYDKRIPRWVLDLPPNKLKILLDALVAGDGSIQKNSGGNGYKYFSISKDLCDDVQEVAFKCGFAPNTYTCKNGQGTTYWVTSWTENSRGSFPRVYGNENHRNANIEQIDYDDLVWCFEVPTGLFVSRRNGKITIQGNSKFAQADNLVNPITLIKVGGAQEGEYHPTSDDLEKWRQTFESAQYDKDFKIISHAGISVERVGASGSVIDISGDMTFIMDNIMHGLMVPKAVITQEGASFNSATVGLEVLKQRYESFRNMMSQWLTKKVFAPISEIQEFYEYKDGDKKLIVPEVEWNRMILFDMDNYINVLNGLVQNQKVSQTTLYRSLGLNIEEERRLLKEETINGAIAAKEMAIMQGMTLGALRALKSDEDIIEPTEAPLPGTPGAEDAGVPGAAPVGIPPMGGLGGGGLPPMGGGGIGGGGFGGLPPGGGMDTGLGGPPPAGPGAGAPSGGAGGGTAPPAPPAGI